MMPFLVKVSMANLSISVINRDVRQQYWRCTNV
jgi:hypothetical protein